MKLQRMIDFVLLMVVIDLADVFVRFLLVGFGVETSAFALSMVGVFALWTKLGALLLTWRNLPFRTAQGTSLAIGKITILSLFWPLVVGHPSLSWAHQKPKD